jgi:hypothetical protein
LKSYFFGEEFQVNKMIIILQLELSTKTDLNSQKRNFTGAQSQTTGHSSNFQLLMTITKLSMMDWQLELLKELHY